MGENMKCTNCNVTVADYLDKCPLCNKKLDSKSKNSVYNSEIEEFSTRINLLYFSSTLIKTLILTNIICIICNISINKCISWSIYVIFSSLFISSFALYIILKNKKIALILNTIFLELLLFMISYQTNNTSWFIYLVGPFILLLLLLIILNIYLSKHNNVLRNMSCLLIFIAFSLSIIDGCIHLFNKSNIIFTWSIYSNIPILIISIILMILSFNKKITEEIEKRFFI